MRVFNLSSEQAFEAYGLACKQFLPNKLIERCPVGAMSCTVKSGTKSVRHNHHEIELFYIISGSGIVISDEFTQEVKSGDMILLPAFSQHVVENNPDSPPLCFLTFWWEDLDEIQKENNKKHEFVKRDIVVTAAPPTPNGALHLGHLAGPYLGADIFKRFQQYLGHNVKLVTGTDDNQTYVKTKAMQLDRQPNDIASENRALIEQTLAAANIEVDYFYDPKSQPGYETAIRNFFTQLNDKGRLIVKSSQEYFDQNGNYLHEALITGLCPNCGAGCDGNCCEQCGQPNQIIDLVRPRALLCGGELTKKSVQKLYFPLSEYRDELVNYYSTLDLSGHLLKLIDDMMSKELPDIAVSHPTEWGISHDIPGFQDHAIYVWGELLVGYLSATEFGTEQPWERYQEKVQFFGFDNSFYHLVLYPAMLIANDMRAALPDQFIINEFLNLDGMKFSTSRNHLIWAHEFCQSEDVNGIRLYLSSIRPEHSTENFEREGYEKYKINFLKNTFMQNIRNFWQAIAVDFEGKIPEAGAWNKLYQQQYRLITDNFENSTRFHYRDSFSPQSVILALESLLSLVTELQKKSTFIRHSKLNYNLYRTNVALQALAIKVISHALVGIAPDIANRLWSELGFNVDMRFDSNLSFIAGGQQIRPQESEYFIL